MCKIPSIPRNHQSLIIAKKDIGDNHGDITRQGLRMKKGIIELRNKFGIHALPCYSMAKFKPPLQFSKRFR